MYVISRSRLRIAALIGRCTSGRKRHFHTKVGNSRTTSGAWIQSSFTATKVGLEWGLGARGR